MSTARTKPRPRLEVGYVAVWRWHFYAGLFCIPFVVLLALTGSVYLFKPQIERSLERRYDGLELQGPPARAADLVAAAVGAVPRSAFAAYELPQHSRSAVRVLVSDPSGEMHRVYVRPDTLEVLAVKRESRTPMELVRKLHGALLLGVGGSIVVELAGSWAIVMILTGLYLWWPRQPRGLGGILYPRLGRGGRGFWRDLHAVTGLWASFFILFLLLTALPWTTVWAPAVTELRKRVGHTVGTQDWVQNRAVDAAHIGHRLPAAAHDGHVHAIAAQVSLDAIVARVTPLHLIAPVLVVPPTPAAPNWAIRSMTQNRTLRAEVDIDPATGVIVRQEAFSDRPLLDQIFGFGVAAHEGQLFGPLNQALGLFTAAALITVTTSAVVMWWRRRPPGVLGAPAPPSDPRLGRGLLALVLSLAVFLPVFGLSLVLMALLERLALRRIPRLRGWLGLSAAA